MRYLFFLGLILSSCGLSEIQDLDNSLKQLIDQRNCSISLETENSEVLRLTYGCELKNEYEAGLVLIDAYDIFKSNRLEYKSYIIANNNDEIVLEIDHSQIDFLVNKENVYNLDLKRIKNGDSDFIYNKLSQSLKGDVDVLQFQSDLKTLDFIGFHEFEGFSIEVVEEKEFIFFASSNDRGNLLSLGYLNEENDSIYGFSVL